MDGSTTGNPGPSGIGGVLRYDKGIVMAVFSFSVGIGDENTSELKVLLQVMRMIEFATRSRSMKMGRVVIANQKPRLVGYIQPKRSCGRSIRRLLNFQPLDIDCCLLCLSKLEIWLESQILWPNYMQKAGCIEQNRG